MTEDVYAQFVDEQTGQAMSDAQWLDTHFVACLEGYRRCVELTPLQPGMRVLDAGCGSGGFIPFIADKVGAAGSVMAVDLAADNVEVTRRRAAQWGLPTRVEAQVGDLLDLPFDNEFDAVWCANVSELLSDEQLDTMLTQFERAVRPGGLIAIKGFDSQLIRFHPEAIQDAVRGVFHDVRASSHDFRSMAHATRRMASLRFLLAARGYEHVAQHDVLIDHCAPLDEPKRRWTEQFLTLFGGIARDLGATGDLAAQWDALCAFEAPEHPLNQPDFLFTEASTVAYGRTPEEA